MSDAWCRWNKYLAKFVNSLCKHLNKRLAKEAAPPQRHVSNGSGADSGNGAVSSGRQHVSTETQRRVAQIILRMADKAQYSKVGQGANLSGLQEIQQFYISTSRVALLQTVPLCQQQDGSV